VISGTGYSEVSRRAEKPLGSLAVDAARKAADEAGIRPDEIDGLCVFPSTARRFGADVDGVDSISNRYLAGALKLKEIRWSTAILPGSFIGSVIEAANAVAAGACTYALCWRALHNPPGKFGRYSEPLARGDDQFAAPYGLAGVLTTFAFPYARYMARYGATREHMAAFVVNNRRNAALNPDAVFAGRPITREEYLNAQMIVEPISLLDCDMPVDGVGAVIVTNADRESSAGFPAAHVGGYAGVIPDNTRLFHNTLEDYELTAARLGRVLWESSGLGPGDVDVANLYDGFSYFTYIYLEALGFCGRGEGYEYIQDGRIEVGGELPLNTSGGSLGMGRLHGPPQVIESVRQLQGRCGERQVPAAEVAVSVTGSPRFGGAGLVLTREPIQ
jgi:acetyl-CoA acetyltransferase